MIPFRIAVRTIVVSGLAAAALTIGAGAVDIGTVDANSLNLRKEPDTSASVLASAPEGSTVLVHESAGEWSKVTYNDIDGYMSSQYLKLSGSADIELGTGIVTADVVNVRSKPSTSGEKNAQVLKGGVLQIVGVESGWYKVKFGKYSGYVHPDFLEIKKAQPVSRATATAERSKGSEAKAEDSAPANPPKEYNAPAGTTGQDVVDYAKQFLGVRYKYGSASPKNGFDCSGFTSYVFKQFGYSLNRTSTGQYKNDGVRVDKSELIPGDLVFFTTHVGIYIGGGNFIHASSSGDYVKITSLSDSYYLKHYLGAARVIK